MPEVRAVLWKHGKIRDLGTLGGSSSFSQAINNRGQVTGLALNGIPDPFSFYYQFLYCLPFQICPPNATQTRAFLWDEEDGMQDIGTLGGPDAFPSLINQRGQVAGFSYTSSIPDPNVGLPPLHPFLWEKGKGMKDLGSFGGVQTASVNGLNERGEVVGGLDLPEEVGNLLTASSVPAVSCKTDSLDRSNPRPVLITIHGSTLGRFDAQATLHRSIGRGMQTGISSPGLQHAHHRFAIFRKSRN